MDLVGRPPYPTEIDLWTGQPLDQLVHSLVSGEEFWRNWLEEQLYFFMLIDNFRPAADSVGEIPEEIAGGRLGVREALHRICLSSSFDRRNPGPDTFVTVVMEQLLGLTVQKVPRELELGKRMYDGTPGRFLGMTGDSQADVVRIALSDQATLPHFLQREYQRLLRRAPERRELAEWTARLSEDALAYSVILQEWYLSPAYERRLATRAPEPNRLFVRALFVDLAGRLPDEGETQRIRNALDGLADAGPLRSLVARLILDSGQAKVPRREEIDDPAAWIRATFERFLGRLPDASEQAVFLESYQDPSCKPSTVLYAIVSHPEYQTW